MDAFTWTALVGTVGIAVLAIAGFVIVFMLGARALSGGISDRTTDLLVQGPTPGHVARNNGRDHDRALRTLQADQRRRLVDRRREAAEAAIFRVCKSASTQGHRDPDAAA